MAAGRRGEPGPAPKSPPPRSSAPAAVRRKRGAAALNRDFVASSARLRESPAGSGALALIILDGWGLAPAGPGNAISQADTPVFDGLWDRYPHTTLSASGRDVGLPDGQMGNSEVGHLNLGRGRW